MATILHRPVCDLLGCTYPIVQAGMGGVARSELVVAVTKAGGFGFLGMVREPTDLIRAEVEALRSRGIERFGVNLIPAATERVLLDAQVLTCIEVGVPVVSLFWDVPLSLVRRLCDAGIVVACQTGSLAEARAMEDAGAQILIAQGIEAGGHVRGDLPLNDLLPGIVEQTEVPVLAAGGLTNGADLATMLSLGAQGGVFGTALIATREAFAHDYHKQRLVDADGEDTILTDAFHINWPRGAKVRVLANSVTRGKRGDPFSTPRTIIGDEAGRPIYLFSTDSPLRSMTGDFEAMALYAGKGVARVSGIASATERVCTIAAEAMSLLDAGVPSQGAPIELASPACCAHEMDDRYMGFAGCDTLLPALNELLEAERAGARVMLRTASEAPEALKSLVMAIHRDKVRWCGVLTRAVHRLEGVPSRKTGALHEQAMTIADIPERLAFLNRGQGWVARKLKMLLPTIRDETIHADLAVMLASHESDISLVTAELPVRPYADIQDSAPGG
jgi:nitronate monooxygenase